MANINHSIKYKVSNLYASSLRLVGKPNIPPWAPYPTGYNLMTGGPNVPPSSDHTPPSLGFLYTWIYSVNELYAHDVYNIIAESICTVNNLPTHQLGDVYYAYKPVCNQVTWSLGTEPVSGDPALIFTWTSLCSVCKNIKEYIITYAEAGSGNPPFSVTIPFATVYADPSFPSYTAYITDSVDPLLTYEVGFQAVLTYEYDVDLTADPTGHITVEQYIDGCLTP